MTRAEKIVEAVEKIGASKNADGYVYRADETGEWYQLTEDEMVELSDLMHDPDPAIRNDAYSHWCNATGTLIGDDVAARAAGLID
jgi:oligoendopeptidase F